MPDFISPGTTFIIQDHESESHLALPAVSMSNCPFLPHIVCLSFPSMQPKVLICSFTPLVNHLHSHLQQHFLIVSLFFFPSSIRFWRNVYCLFSDLSIVACSLSILFPLMFFRSSLLNNGLYQWPCYTPIVEKCSIALYSYCQGMPISSPFPSSSLCFPFASCSVLHIVHPISDSSTRSTFTHTPLLLAIPLEPVSFLFDIYLEQASSYPLQPIP